MKKIITLLIGCSLMLTIGVRAAQKNPENPEEKPVQKSKPVQKQQFTPKQRMAPNTHVQGVPPQHKAPVVPYNARIHDNNVPRQQLHKLPPVQTNKLPVVPINKAPVIQSDKEPMAPISKAPVIQSNKVPMVQPNKMPPVLTNKVPMVQPNTMPPIQPNKVPVVQTNKRPVQTFQRRHQNFRAQPKSAIVSAQFNQHHRIHGSDNWRGNHYNAFRSYHPQWHDRNWWHSHHNHIVLIGGGWYFWNAGYWYPAWGYDTSAAYYPYDGPIYVGNDPKPFDQIVADVQTSLQEQGYYHGEVDGLVGPLTQEALAEYQRAQGLEPTAAIDEPTLESLGLT